MTPLPFVGLLTIISHGCLWVTQVVQARQPINLLCLLQQVVTLDGAIRDTDCFDEPDNDIANNKDCGDKGINKA